MGTESKNLVTGIRLSDESSDVVMKLGAITFVSTKMVELADCVSTVDIREGHSDHQGSPSRACQLC